MRAQAAPSSSATSSPLASLKAARRALTLALLRLSVITAGGDHTGLFEGAFLNQLFGLAQALRKLKRCRLSFRIPPRWIRADFPKLKSCSSSSAGWV
jgi:hypothetical protein